MTVSLRLDTACFTSILIECFFFGFYTFLFIVGARLFFSTARGRIPLSVSIPSLLLYIVAAAHITTTIKHGSVGFIQIASQGHVDAAINYFATTVNATNILNHCLYVINNFIGDSILIWRCWIVWGRNWKVVVVPLATLCTSAVAGFMVAYNFSRSTDGPFSTKLDIVANIFFGSIFCTNTMVTSLTAWRIWKCRKLSVAAGATTDYTGAFNIVVESGAIYSLILAMEMLLYAVGQNFVFVLYTSMAQITGIAPTGIIVLVLLGRTLRHTTNTSGALPSLRATRPSHSQSGIALSSRAGPPSPLELHGRRTIPHHIQIDIKSDPEIVLDSQHDTEADSLQKRHPSGTDEVWTPDQEVGTGRVY